ncbi:MAG: Phospholipase D1 [Trizodia sp. TS-e1964]|nr:MAG: Phospholipase D1 [Trizodia sp. TS-e1964]
MKFPISPASDPAEVHPSPRPDEDGSEADADEESAGDEAAGTGPSRRYRKRSKRPSASESKTAPTTPRRAFDRFTHFPHSHGGHTISASFSPEPLQRSATMTDIQEHTRGSAVGGLSENETMGRPGKQVAWKRGSTWVHGGRGMTFHGSHASADPANTEGKRPSAFRRFTGLGSSHEGAEATSPGPWRNKAERTSTLSAAKWRQMKAKLMLIGQRKREENKIDHVKSAELLAELSAATPAAVILASMFLRDERGNKRIPVLLEQLKVHLTDSKKVDANSASDRHLSFRIELEYGSGLTRMKWVIHRSVRDFANLHLRYKVQSGSDKILLRSEDGAKQKLPRFPKSAVPYLKGIRGLNSDDEDDEDVPDDDTGPSAGEGVMSGTDRQVRKKKRRPSLIHSRRRSSVGGSYTGDAALGTPGAPDTPGDVALASATRRETYAERQRKKLEIYLQQMIRHLIFRPDSNRLCKFLELSALGVRLAAEGTYHGKEGYMIIQTAKGIDFRKGLNPILATKRHSPKWFLVRHSYIVCVDSPEEMNIYDVFLVDSDFTFQWKSGSARRQATKELALKARNSAAPAKHHTLKVRNSERKLKLIAKNERQLHQFEESIGHMQNNTIWSHKNRFDSFAPVRHNVHAQWLVDGRDYMWNVSRAISEARDVIYIHDWWLSPEIYMRRPAAISQRWRLDRLLQRKASEGVKIFIIMYRNIQSAIPIDSSYSKYSLLDLHPNVFVQRSPNQFRQNTFFWAHHEKICVVDHMVGFVGGIDLCFGRWDTPQHSVVDDKLTGFELTEKPKDSDNCQMWPGKDYSNPRVQDFYALDKPYEEMYDRTKVPRMPWHDISMQVVGQPARDLTRHFVQRWNYVLRQRTPSRPTPFLLPPPDFRDADLEALGIDGTCQIQILRSCCWWSMGTPDKTEISIMNGYVKMIEKSEHFVYIENQFFITSCEVEGTKIENHIGDALVERVIRAAQNDEDWRAVILIPLMPGFQSTVDTPEGTSVRLIMQCQYRSICRGDSSIFGRLRAEGIEPEEYIQFYSLRTWGKIGPSQMLVTEQLYIHAKCMIVDDRTAIIGSANINERSMIGTRDSEAAAIVTDTFMIDSTMGGQPYKVGRFAHTLRMRLMREHLGLDVDQIDEDARREAELLEEKFANEMSDIYGEGEASTATSPQPDKESKGTTTDAQHRSEEEAIATSDQILSFNHDVDWEQGKNPNTTSRKKPSEDSRVQGNTEHQKDVEGDGGDHMIDALDAGLGHGRDTALLNGKNEVLIKNIASEGKGTLESPNKNTRPRTTSTDSLQNTSIDVLPPLPEFPRSTTAELGLPMLSQLPALPILDDADIGGPSVAPSNLQSVLKDFPLIADIKTPTGVDKDCMKDPLDNSFLDKWQMIAENNTRLYRQVFRCMPDNEVKSWKEYKEYVAYAERFAQAQGVTKNKSRMQQELHSQSGGPVGHHSGLVAAHPLSSIGEKIESIVHEPGKSQEAAEISNMQDWAADLNKVQGERAAAEKENKVHKDDALDEKSDTLRSSENSRTSEFPQFAPAATEAEKLQRNQSPSVGFSEPLQSIATNTTSTTTSKRRRRTTTRSSRREFNASDDLPDLADAEALMDIVQGNLVIWPYDWLMREEQGGNWLYSIDQIAPLEI